jgi:hypothetical protein
MKGYYMSGVWIYQKNKQDYINIMNEECGGPHIIEETADKLKVDFCSPAMSVWVSVGFWYSFD